MKVNVATTTPLRGMWWGGDRSICVKQTRVESRLWLVRVRVRLAMSYLL